MRRPVKPFVTEYKASNRRSGQPAGTAPRRAADTLFTLPPTDQPRGRESPRGSDHPRHDGRVDHQRGHEGARHEPAQGEDAYEAALRAADALFSPAKKAEPAGRAGVRQTASAAAMSADPGQADEAEARDDPGPEDAAGRAGRVLRALEADLPPAPVMPDDEPVARRRGRKPGSKNRPKSAIPGGTVAGPETPSRLAEPVPATLERLAPGDAAPPPSPAGPAGLAAFAAAPLDEAEDDAFENLPIAATSGRRAAVARRPARRFAWVRKTLGPGEQWKRRLPKVCW